MSDHARNQANGWDDAPVRAKATAVATLAAMMGLATGLLEVKLGGRLVILLAGVSVTFGVAVALVNRWIARPIERLTDQFEAMAADRKPTDLSSLPTVRRDEVGRIAQAVQTIAVAAVRNHHEAQHLRQTLDHRVKAETAAATRKLEAIAMRDPLTALGNRRFLDDRLAPLLAAARLSGIELVCVAIDVDKFKHVNDSLGHKAGDDLLVLLGGLIKAGVRHDDLSVRLGGDEFIILMPAAEAERIGAFTEGLRQHFRQRAKAMFPDGPHANLSIGVGRMFADGCADGAALLAAADRRLYEAKQGGRGRTVGLSLAA